MQLIEDYMVRHDDSFGTRLGTQWEVGKEVVAGE
jgi:hypothetical protein